MSQTVKELHEKRKKLWENSISRHGKYIDPKTGLFRNEYVEYRNCPVCGRSDCREIFFKEGGTYSRCQKCGMVYLNPVFTDTALNDYYDTNHAVQAEIVESDGPFYKNLYNKGLDGMEKFVLPGKILDIGCSSGVFLDLSQNRNWETFGIELNASEFDIVKTKGHEVYSELLENINFDIKFDAITLWDVFEHIKDGHFYLGLMKKILSDNGVIFLQIPSSGSLAAKILQEKCNMFDGLEHVNLYNAETIRILAEKSGFDVLEMQSVIPEIGVINNYFNYDDPYLGSSENKTDIPDIIDEKALIQKLMGYKLQVVLRGEK